MRENKRLWPSSRACALVDDPIRMCTALACMHVCVLGAGLGVLRGCASPNAFEIPSANASLLCPFFSAAGLHWLGQRVRVFWKDDLVWYAGCVDDYLEGSDRYHIVYDDDGMEEWLTLPSVSLCSYFSEGWWRICTSLVALYQRLGEGERRHVDGRLARQNVVLHATCVVPHCKCPEIRV